MMEVVDGADALALPETPPGARGQDRHPEKHYEDQQDHNRHSPTTYLRSLKNPSELGFTNGGWLGKCTAPTSSTLLRSLRLYPQQRPEARTF